MTHKFLLTVLLTSLSSIGLPTSIVTAQELPKCYSIDSSGKLTDLTDFCFASKRSPNPVSAANKNSRVDNINVIGINPLNAELSGNNIDKSVNVLEGVDLAVESDLIDGSYFIDNEIGSDFTVYTRRFGSAPTSKQRRLLREQSFGFDSFRSNDGLGFGSSFDSSFDSPTSIIRRGRSKIPFLIYRYPN